MLPFCGGVHVEGSPGEHTFPNEYTIPPELGGAVGRQNIDEHGPPETFSAPDQDDTLGGYIGLGFSNPASSQAGPQLGSRMMTAPSVSNVPTLPLTETTTGSAAEACADAPSGERSEAVTEPSLSEPQIYQDLTRPQQLSIQSTALATGESFASAKMMDVSDSPLSSAQRRSTQKTRGSIISQIQSMIADAVESPVTPAVKLGGTQTLDVRQLLHSMLYIWYYMGDLIGS